MTGNFLIGLREGLEAVLLVVLLLAYLRKSGRTALIPRIFTGVAVAIAVSLGFGALLTFGPRGLTFEAQEAIGGGLSILAVGFVTWMVFWMASASKTLASDLRGKVDEAAEGSGWALVLVAALAVGREGLETALFLWAATRATGETWQPLLGATLGILVAVGLGALLHRGVLRINLSKFFTWTGAALIVVAGGVLAYGVHDLQEAGILPGLHHLAFDVSHLIAPSGFLGTLLKGIFNFSPATTWVEAITWVAYVVPVTILYFRKIHTHNGAKRAASPQPVSA
ncbi:FTR1 family protein [Paeniglutamicibacter psychrophenolicus]|uniref:High-affinity iron transporter n=1 Tax=Paeniglutamicibacter psychrophenolicus TaxID=257454 RepID=A0ABS4WCJ1_9MICC|nr:iron uptake transporter permease EfeU [Paeniglutamicibacter psychrophenolicus]MBP2373926.1 high-affinity iron transporter [Paeniglutamicibacter psychrophenolicus]